MDSKCVNVVGAGLAGCEAAFQLTKQGIQVRLYEMKPGQKSPAHKQDDFAELVCSNSLRSDSLANGVGLLKFEMRQQGSLIMAVADRYKLAAGSALAVDREAFSQGVSKLIRTNPLIEVIEKKVDSLSELPAADATVIASGPLTSDQLFADLELTLGSSNLHFFDAAAPVVYADSIDLEKVFFQSRYRPEERDYLNCPLDREQYQQFHRDLLAAQKMEFSDFESTALFNGCMPIEALAAQGYETMRFGPLKPVGLVDPRSGEEPYAVVQLRRDNQAGSLYNLVGFQTRLLFPDQRRVFRTIPGLEEAVFARYGVMHRNSYLNSPSVLTANYRAKAFDDLYFAGQITGVEGYVESAASGLLVGIELGRKLHDSPPLFDHSPGMIKALADYVYQAEPKHFQPMNANFGLLLAVETSEKKRIRQTYGLTSRQRKSKRLVYTVKVLEQITDLPQAAIKELVQAELK